MCIGEVNIVVVYKRARNVSKQRFCQLAYGEMNEGPPETESHPLKLKY